MIFNTRDYHSPVLRIVAFVSLLCTQAFAPLFGPAAALSQSVASRRDTEGPNNFPVTFVDVAAQAGLTAPIIYGGVDQKKYIIETNGCGVAFIDYDNDGWTD